MHYVKKFIIKFIWIPLQGSLKDQSSRCVLILHFSLMYIIYVRGVQKPVDASELLSEKIKTE